MKKEPKLSSLIDKAVFDYNLIEKDDKILIGASGGKDSTLLLEYFSNRMKRPDPGFSYKAIHIKSDFAEGFPEEISKMIGQWNVPFETINVNVLERVQPGQKMSCYWCSTQRRTELLKYAIDNGYNKIALGHHMDDILETLLMNMLNKAELAAMPPKLKYNNFPVTIIRPLCYISEERIIAHSREAGYGHYTCTCNYQDNSTRKEARKLLETITEGDRTKKERLFKSLKNIQKEYLP